MTLGLGEDALMLFLGLPEKFDLAGSWFLMVVPLCWMGN